MFAGGSLWYGLQVRGGRRRLAWSGWMPGRSHAARAEQAATGPRRRRTPRYLFWGVLGPAYPRPGASNQLFCASTWGDLASLSALLGAGGGSTATSH